MHFSKFLKNPAPELKGGESRQLREKELQQGPRRVLICGDRVKERLKVERSLWAVRDLSNLADEQEGGTGVRELFFVVACIMSGEALRDIVIDSGEGVVNRDSL